MLKLFPFFVSQINSSSFYFDVPFFVTLEFETLIELTLFTEKIYVVVMSMYISRTNWDLNNNNSYPFWPIYEQFMRVAGLA